MATKQKPKKPTLKMTTERVRKAATMKAQGQSYETIGKEISVAPSTVFRALQKDELNQIIKEAQNDLIRNSLRNAVENQSQKIKISANIVNKIDNGEKLTDGATKLIELAQQCENRLLESVGIHPSHAQSIQINNILVDNRSELSPAIENMLMRHLAGNVKVEGNVIEPEFSGTPLISADNQDVSA